MASGSVVLGSNFTSGMNLGATFGSDAGGIGPLTAAMATSNTTIVLTLDTTAPAFVSPPAVTGFSVTVSGVAATISSAAWTAFNQITITLSGAAAFGVPTRVSYAPGDAADSNGTPVVTFSDFFVTNNGVAGTLDLYFNSNGKTEALYSPTENYCRALLIQPDEKIISIGYEFQSGADYDVLLVRFNSNGSVDTTFGVNGYVHTQLAVGPDEGLCGYLQSDGKIVISGLYDTMSPDIFNPVILRYNSNGSVDTTFGTNGVAQPHIGDWNNQDCQVNGIDRQADGKFVFTGYAGRVGVAGQWAFAARIDGTTGALDSSFGTGGVFFFTAFTSSSTGRGIKVRSSDQYMYVTGDTNSNTRYFCARLKTNGTLDGDFNITGYNNPVVGTGSASTVAWDLKLDSGSLPVMCGQALDGVNGIRVHLAKFTSGGLLDNGFGVSGIAKGTTAILSVRGLAIQSNDKIVTIGLRSSSGFNVQRFLANGSVDTSTFGTSGILAFTFRTNADQGRAAAIQSWDGKIVVGGYSDTGSVTRVALARIWA